MSVYLSVVWSLPGVVCALGISGAVAGRARDRRDAPPDDPQPVVVDELVVVVPTIGRIDTARALVRVVDSLICHLPPRFAHLAIDVVIDEGSEVTPLLYELEAQEPLITVIEVPAEYQTPHGTRFKARANHYAAEERRRRGDARRSVWVLHLDDDTAIGSDTAVAIAAFVHRQRANGVHGLHLAQGLLTYPRELADSWITWMADAVRPGCDLSLFMRSTGTGAPRAGLHGELLLVRASVEDVIGWDFGPRSIVEDADFALRFCDLYPGGSGWLAGRSYGASPATIADLLRQRERWVWGLLELVCTTSVGLRQRLLLTHNVIVWSLAPLGHPLVVAVVAVAVGTTATPPATVAVAPVWALTVAFVTWLYWEGLKVNRRSSADPRVRVVEQCSLLLLLPFLTLLEVIGVVRGVVRYLRRDHCQFVVIAKPH